MTTATEAAAEMNKTAAAMGLASERYNANPCSETAIALDAAMAAHRAAGDRWAAAFVAEMDARNIGAAA